MIAQDILHKAQADDSLDVWAEVQTSWSKFEEFLRRLNYQKVDGWPIFHRIYLITGFGKSAFVFPGLDEVGRITFRSQVPHCHHPESSDRPLVCCLIATALTAKG